MANLAMQQNLQNAQAGPLLDKDGQMLNMDQEQFAQYMEKEYEKIAEDLEAQDMQLGDVWSDMAMGEDQAQTVITEDAQQKLNKRLKYTFQAQNPYQQEKDYIKLYQKFIDAGRTNEAILALEAYIQQNPKSGQHWRILGILHQEND